MASFLTGKQARKTNGSDIRVGISVDQMAALSPFGEQTRLPSLEIGCEGGKLVGNCDSGNSCAYVIAVPIPPTFRGAANRRRAPRRSIRARSSSASSAPAPPRPRRSV
jgi:hypothetical protein